MKRYGLECDDAGPTGGIEEEADGPLVLFTDHEAEVARLNQLLLAREGLTSMAVDALRYVVNTGGNCTVAIFDDDHEPIGPMLRSELIPHYMREVDGRLKLTTLGRATSNSPINCSCDPDLAGGFRCVGLKNLVPNRTCRAALNSERSR